MGINSALNISKDVLDKLDKAQGAVDQLAKDSETVAKNFDTISQKIKDIGNIKVDLTKVFDVGAVTNQLQNLGKILQQLQGVQAGAAGKAGKSVTRNFQAELDKIMDRAGNTYAKIKSQIASLQNIFDNTTDVNIKTQADAAIKSLEERLKALGLAYDEVRAKEAKARAESIDIVDKNSAADKVRALKEAIEEYKKAPIDPNNINGTNDILKDLREKLKDAEEQKRKFLSTKSFDGLNKELTNIQRAIKGCEQNAAFASNAFKQAFNIFPVTTFLSQLVSIRGEFEMAERSLSVILQSETKMAEVLNTIKEMSVESPYSAMELVKHTKQLAAFRIEADKLTDTTKMLGDIAAGTGVDMSRLILAYGQVKSAEFLKGTELRQFSEAGVNMLGGLAERFSEIYNRAVSVGEVMGMISKRMVKFADVEAVLMSSTQKGGVFYNMQAQQADTIHGMVANLKDRLAIAFNDLGEQYEGIIKKVLGGVEVLIEKLGAVDHLLLPLVTGKLVSGVFGMISKSAFSQEVSELIKRFKTLNGGVNSAVTATVVWRKSLQAVGNVLKTNIVGIFVTIVALIVQAAVKAGELKRNLKKIESEALDEITDQVNRYDELADAASNVSLKERERLEALTALKEEYGHIINLQNMDLKNAEKLRQIEGETNEIREQHIHLIRLQAAEEAKVKAYTELMSSIRGGSKAQFKQIWNNGDFYGLKSLYKKDIPGIVNTTQEEIRQAIENVNQAIFNETIDNAKDARDEFISQILSRSGATNEQIEQALSRLGEGSFKFILTAFDSVIEKMEKLEGFGNNFGIDMNITRTAEAYRKEIEKISNAANEFNDNLTESQRKGYEQNPAQKKMDMQTYIEGVAGTVRESIKNKSFGDISTALQEKLASEVEKAFSAASLGNNVEMWVLEMANQVNEEFPDLQKPFGDALYSLADGEEIEKLVERLRDRQKELEKDWKKLFHGKEGDVMSVKNVWGENAALKIGQELDATERFIELINSGLSDKEMKEGHKNLEQRKADLQSLASDIIKLTEDWHNLSEAEQDFNRDNIGDRAFELGIQGPDEYTIESVGKWIEDTVNKRVDPKMRMSLAVELDKQYYAQAKKASSEAADIVNDMLTYYRKTFHDKYPEDVSTLIMDALQGRVDEFNKTPGVSVELPLQVNIQTIKDWVEKNRGLFSSEDLTNVLLKLYEEEANDDASKKERERQFKADLKDFLSMLKSAKKEMDALTESEDELFVKALQIKGKKIGVRIADNFEPTLETVNTLINKYLPFLSKDEQLEIKLAWSKEETQAFLEDTRNEISDLWSKFDTAKKFEDYGISMKGYDKSAIMSELESIEANLRGKDFEGAIKLAEEIRQKRVSIARDEWEEIAKIMAKTQEEALSKTVKAYQTAHKDITKFLSIENPYGKLEPEDRTKFVNNRLSVMLKEAADAEWEAYKGTEMYVAAFGNLEGMEKEILESLKGYLEGIDTSKLNPSDAKAVAKALESLNKALLETEKYSSVWDMVKKGFEDVNAAAKMYREDIPVLSDEVIQKEEEYGEAKKVLAKAQEDYNDALEEYLRVINDPHATQEQKDSAKNRLDETGNNLVIAQGEVESALGASSEALGEYNDALDKANTLAERGAKNLNAVGSAMGNIGSAISSAFDLVENIASVLGSEVPESVSTAFDAFSEGFSVVAQTITTVASALQAYSTVKAAIEKLKGLSLGPLIIVAAAIAAIVAALKAYDKVQAAKIEAHRKNVENLNKAYDKLNKSLDDSVLTMEDLNDLYGESASNLRRQREEIEEAIALNNTRKQTKKVKEESEALQDELDSINEKMTELDTKRKEILGAPDFSDTGKSWASSFLSQFDEVGDGLTALEDSFDEFYNNLIAGQLTHKVFAESMKRLEKMTQEILADSVVTPEESLALKKYRETELALLNERGKALAEALGMSGDRSTEHSLSKNVGNITSAQATALEALMNSERYYSADSNMRLVNVERTLTTEGEGTILSQIKAQAMYLKSMSDIAKAVYNPTKSAIKVVID